MGSISIVTTVINTVKNCHSWILRKFGLKTVPIDKYKDETTDVKPNYPEISPLCIKEKNNGAIFYWSKDYNPKYERYFEIDGNVRRYFICNENKLWIKR